MTRSKLYTALAAALALLIAYPVFAVTYNNVPTLPLAPRLFMVGLQNSTGTGLVTLATCGSNTGQATKIQSVIANNNDFVNAYTLVLTYNRTGSGLFQIVDVNVPSSAGALTNVAPVNVIGPSSTAVPGLATDAYGPYILCQLNDSLQVNVTTTITAGKDVNVIATGGDF
jgi:hypothetical protein